VSGANYTAAVDNC